MAAGDLEQDQVKAPVKPTYIPWDFVPSERELECVELEIHGFSCPRLVWSVADGAALDLGVGEEFWFCGSQVKDSKPRNQREYHMPFSCVDGLAP